MEFYVTDYDPIQYFISPASIEMHVTMTKKRDYNRKERIRIHNIAFSFI